MRRFAVDQVVMQVQVLFESVGVLTRDAADVAQMLVRTDCRGIKTHGLIRVESYLALLRAGRVKAQPRVDERSLVPTVSLVHGDNGLGQVVGTVAMKMAIKLAGQYGLGVCLIEQCGHMGALGLYAERAADVGMFGVVSQSTVPSMVVPGGGSPAIGNNPLAFAAPMPSGAPLVFDMSCSVAARGNVIVAEKFGRPIPEGWAVDKTGHSTTDPAVALQGGMLPVGAHKGLGLAMIVQSLAGVLSGTPMLPRESSEGSLPHAGSFILVINGPKLVGGVEELANRINQWTSTFRTLAGARARFPGQHARDKEQEALRGGLPLEDLMVANLSRLCKEYGVEFFLRS